MKLKFDGTICQDLEQSSRLEWLETNGLGGFASGTVSGIHTRRYHGLLTAALHPPVGRMLLVAKFEDTLIVDERRVELSANRYDGAVHPVAADPKSRAGFLLQRRNGDGGGGFVLSHAWPVSDEGPLERDRNVRSFA